MQLRQSEIEQLKEDYESTFQDVCTIGVPIYPDPPEPGAESHDYGQEETDYEWGEEIPCGLEVNSPQQEGEIGQNTIAATGTLRLPYAVADLHPDCRIRIIKHNHNTVDWVVSIEGYPQIGLTGIRVAVRAATGGTAR